MRGYIKLDRQMLDHWLWQEKPFSKGQAWIDMLYLANWNDRKELVGDHIEDRPRGSFVCSWNWLAERWGWNRKTVDKFLKALENDKMIRRERTVKGTTITIENYARFQDSGTTERTDEWTGEWTTERTTEWTHKKKREEEKEKKKRSVYGTHAFKPPTIEDLEAYAAERTALGHVKIDVHRFHDYYNSNGWRVGKNPMKDWKAAYRTWERKEEQDSKGASAPGTPGKTGEFRYMRNGKMVTINE